MQWVINSYHGNTDWVYKYSLETIPVFYNKKDLNVGSNIYDYMDFIVENYNDLPKVTLFGKSNMLERHITKEEFDVLVKRRDFTPLLTQNHGTHLPVSYYKDNLYYEINNSWYFNSYPHKYFTNYPDFAKEMGLPNPEYLGFAPGACYIVPKKNIKKRSKSFYEELRELVSHDANPAEAHAIERSLVNIWS